MEFFYYTYFFLIRLFLIKNDPSSLMHRFSGGQKLRKAERIFSGSIDLQEALIFLFIAGTKEGRPSPAP